MVKHHRPEPPVGREHHELDARQQAVGRLASAAAHFLMGKHKPKFQPQWDDGDFVLVTHAGDLTLSGRKMQQKVYFDMSRYPGGIHEKQVREMIRSHPEDIIRRAVIHMLPRNRHRQARMKRLRILR